MAADQRSALPTLPGIPWWGAAILAVTMTAVGFAYDAGTGSQALSAVFVVFYVLGCIAAILAVRQSGVFTAVIQPPLILFVAVPFAYFVFHGSTFTGVKDLLINCGYPLIERFPLMFFTSATVLLIGMVRWYLGAAARRAVPKDAEAAMDVAASSPDAPEAAAMKASKPRRSTRSATARAATAAAATSAAQVADATPRAPRAPRKSTRPRPAASDAERSAGDAPRTGSRRSRHARPPETEIVDAVPNRPRRRTPPPDAPAEPRRRPRAADPREPRESREPRERRQSPPSDRRSAAERADRYDRPGRRERPDGYERVERPERSQRRPRTTDYEPYEPPPASRPNGASGTHHPVSRVRYRGTDDGESRVEHRTRPRRSRHAAPESWEYDA